QPTLIAFLNDIEKDFIGGGRLIYIGAGTSGRLGVLDASEAPPTFCVPPDRFIGIIAGGDSSLRKSSEGKEDIRDGAAKALSALELNATDTVLGVAAGGTTPYVHGALEMAQEKWSCHTGFITCSSIPQASYIDHLIYCPTGAEVITGSTRMKAGTACKLLLNTISTTLMIRSGHIYHNLMVDVKASNDKLRDRAARIIQSVTELSREQALSLLDQSDGACKTAIVMHRLQLNKDTALQLLEEHHGHLASCLGEC
ncbi:MAG: N-acetylmuramic acid 6-phosphate etherase, partial [Planctomycetes bacterium]|nr:N-acetylmuramic acid 6-phosphate etherase [Planctomycetota bacterium]